MEKEEEEIWHMEEKEEEVEKEKEEVSYVE